jgi:hypothetical protein
MQALELRTQRMRSSRRGFAVLIAAFALFLSLGAPGRASATSILVNGNTQFTVNWFSDVTSPPLEGSARFTIGNFSATGFDLTIDLITNSTSSTPNIGARLTSFGFGLSPNFTSYSSVVNGVTYSWGFSNFPAFGQVDVCGFGGQNCAGGGNGGLRPGQTMPGSMSIHFTGDFANGVTIAPIPVKFQTRVGSFQFDGCVEGDPSCDPNLPLVPEPGTFALVGLGIAAVALRLKRRRRA